MFLPEYYSETGWTKAIINIWLWEHLDPLHSGIYLFACYFQFCMYISVSAVLNICDKTVGVLDEQEGYIASPGYTNLYSVSGSNIAGQYQSPYRCTLTVQVPPVPGFTTLHFYIRDLHFRSNHGPTTPTNSESSDTAIKQTNEHQTCLQFAEALTNSSHVHVKKVCSLRQIGAHGLVFMSSSFRVEITYWSFAEDFNDFLLFYKGKWQLFIFIHLLKGKSFSLPKVRDARNSNT